MDQARNDEIDLSLILRKLWDGKWKIISCIFMFLAISLLYLSSIPNKFKSTTILQKSNQNVYLKYKYLNDILMQETYNNIKRLRTDPKANNANQKFLNDNQQFLEVGVSRVIEVDESRIFNMFFNEFRDYDEMITILSKNDFVKDKIKNLSDKDKRNSLVNFAKQFTIVRPKRDDEDWKLSFIWHQINEGRSLLNDAVDLTLINVQKSLLMQVDNIAKSIDLKNQREINSLNIRLQSIQKLNKLIKAKRISFLTEQSNIAKELGIEKNSSININISQSNDSGNFSNTTHQMENFNSTYFLRGYKAINREIELIRNRSNLNNNLLTKGYIEIQDKLIKIRSDNRSKELRDAKNIIKNDNIAKWINFNLELAEIKNLKKQKLFIFISIILGTILGSFYVLISSNLDQKNNFK